jgi:YesN/AraC family two-component response regulator
MDFLEFDLKERKSEWSMSSLQSHNYYELYFLLQGSRRFFYHDKILNVTAPVACIIPPFCMHKTEGGAYRRININVSPEALSQKEKAFLDKHGKDVVYTLETQKADLFLKLLESSVSPRSNAPSEELASSLLHVLLHLLMQDCLQPFDSRTAEDASVDKTSAMQVVAYIHDHYQEEFSLQDLCERFFVSKNVLCLKFKKLMHCSIMEYRKFIRISKAKELLSSTRKSMKDIANECGFSSENYFSLIFKREVGISPTNYRKAK